MKLIKLYEGIIRENNAQSCVSKFGEILFANPLGGDEKNTKLEDKYVKTIYNFTDYDFGNNLKPAVEKAIIDLKDCMSTYPEVLKPTVEVVFRGASAPIIEFIRNGRLPTYNEAEPFVYRARSPIQSWTEYESVAENFGDGTKLNELAKFIDDYDELTLDFLIPKLLKIRIPVILIYKSSSKDFLFKGEYLNKLSSFGTEHELIRVEDTPIKVNAYLNEKWLSMASVRLINKLNDLLDI